MMHREVIEKKKVPAIAIVLLSITFVLYLSQGIKLAGLNNNFLGYSLNGILLILTVFIVFREIKSCSLAYRYAIIADKLIINKIISRKEKNLESIKIEKILYIGKKSELPKEYVRLKSSKSYLCNRIGDEIYCCVYNRDGNLIKFSFQPSNSFIERIIAHGKLCCKLNNKF